MQRSGRGRRCAGTRARRNLPQAARRRARLASSERVLINDAPWRKSAVRWRDGIERG